MTATTVTSTPDTPVISLSNLDVKIKWDAPTTTNFASVTAYKITIADYTGNFIEDTTYCNGADASIIANLYCLIPMTYLRSSPFSLTYGTLITAKIAAYNQNGWSSSSSVNTVGIVI